jgi:hypothetical protein
VRWTVEADPRCSVALASSRAEGQDPRSRPYRMMARIVILARCSGECMRRFMANESSVRREHFLRKIFRLGYAALDALGSSPCTHHRHHPGVARPNAPDSHCARFRGAGRAERYWDDSGIVGIAERVHAPPSSDREIHADATRTDSEQWFASRRYRLRPTAASRVRLTSETRRDGSTLYRLK